MKRILVFSVCLMFIMCLIGCSEHKKLSEFEMSEDLNKEIKKYFEITDVFVEGEPLPPLIIEDLITKYELSNKYLVYFDKDHKSNYVCAYLNNEVKEVLDTIEIIHEGYESWFIWQGENLYLKKYEYAIEENIINCNDYPLKWIEYKDKEEILDFFEDFFLVSITKSQKINVLNCETKEEGSKVIYIEENSYNFSNLLERKEKFYVLSKKEIKLTDINAHELHSLIKYESFYCKILNDKFYIRDLGYHEKNYDIDDYIIINDYYFCCLDEIIKFIVEQKR